MKLTTEMIMNLPTSRTTARSPLLVAAVILLSPLLLTACKSTMPSARVQNSVDLPVPHLAVMDTDEGLSDFLDENGVLRLTARSLIWLAFNHQPDVASSFQAFKAEEARYDFFYTSRDALTPHLRITNAFNESRSFDQGSGDRIGARASEHNLEVGVDKLFFDTTQLSLDAGLDTGTQDREFASQPFVSASVRYPLGGSREKLERSSEDIFRQNELNDAQLNYIRQTRMGLESALRRFYRVLELREQISAAERWKSDLLSLAEQLDSSESSKRATDRSRVEAELARVSAEVRNLTGRFHVDVARLKYLGGIPYEIELDLDDEPFNPFIGIAHDELLRMAIETDPEIATLQNAMRNAEVQLDLAQRGQWDVTLLVEGQGRLRDSSASSGNTDWSISAGLEVSAVDPRVTDSRERQSRASSDRLRQASVARKRLMYADTLEPFIRIDTLGARREELIGNLTRFQEDFSRGLREFAIGELNIDDLLKRRETLFDQEEEIASLGNFVGVNIAELCTATGKYFELVGLPPE